MESVGWLLFGLSLVVVSLLAGRLARRAAPALVSFGVLLVLAGVLLAVPAWSGIGSRLADIALLSTFLPWLVGRVWRQSRELAWAGWERAERLAAETRLRERAAIAQDMHDVLGHELNLIALRAGALSLAPGLSGEHRAAAGELRASAAAAVDRLGEVVGLLGSPDATPPELEALVAGATASGLQASLGVEGDRSRSPAIVERVLRRIVQECLTNVAKHAPSTTAEVLVTYEEGSVSVRVRNEPVGTQPRRDGRGLAGLRERVRLLGGLLEHGVRDGGFEVVARLPYTAAPLVPAAVEGPVRQARRRFRRELVLAAGLPVAALVLLAGGIKGWSAYLTAQSVLPASTYADLRIGQDRAAVERVLPAREAPDRPADSSCSYYAMTADPMDDRSGDLYRLCWRSGELASLAVVSS
jgi:signal transduction histidine kinase